MGIGANRRPGKLALCRIKRPVFSYFNPTRSKELEVHGISESLVLLLLNTPAAADRHVMQAGMPGSVLCDRESDAGQLSGWHA